MTISGSSKGNWNAGDNLAQSSYPLFAGIDHALLRASTQNLTPHKPNKNIWLKQSYTTKQPIILTSSVSRHFQNQPPIGGVHPNPIKKGVILVYLHSTTLLPS